MFQNLLQLYQLFFKLVIVSYIIIDSSYLLVTCSIYRIVFVYIFTVVTKLLSREAEEKREAID